MRVWSERSRGRVVRVWAMKQMIGSGISLLAARPVAKAAAAATVHGVL
jgi:hypothetical protein